jgi:hypothetical protein
MVEVGPWVCDENWNIYGASGFRFSIYADDMTFSLPYPFNNRPFAEKGDQRSVKGMILSAIEASGLYTVNAEKLRSFNSHKGHPLITGLRVVRNKVGLPKKKVAWLRSFIHHTGQSNDPKVKAQLKGWACYVRMVYEVKGEGDLLKVPSQIREILNY